MLLGTYKLNLSGQNRLALPSRLRKEIKGNRLVVSVGLGDYIAGFGEAEWTKATEQDLSRPLSDPEARDLRRKLCANAELVECDSQGRLVVPQSLMKGKDLKGEMIVIGAGDHFEIWESQKWEKYQEKLG